MLTETPQRLSLSAHMKQANRRKAGRLVLHSLTAAGCQPVVPKTAQTQPSLAHLSERELLVWHSQPTELMLESLNIKVDACTTSTTNNISRGCCTHSQCCLVP